MNYVTELTGVCWPRMVGCVFVEEW